VVQKNLPGVQKERLVNKLKNGYNQFGRWKNFWLAKTKENIKSL